MPIQKQKGLPGLRGWSDLSSEERAAFNAAHPDMKNLSMKQQIYAYRNQQFIDRFGMDAFNQMGRQERDAQYRTAVIGDEVDNVFKDDENYAEIKYMTPDSQYELLNSDYKEATDRVKQLQEFYEKHGDTFRAATLEAGRIGFDIARGRAKNKADRILADIQNKDSQRKADSVSGDAESIAGSIVAQMNSGEVSAEDFNKSFDNIFKGSSQVVNNEMGSYEVVNPGVSHYKAFENAHELQDYTLEDKIKDYSEYMALQRRYGTAAAITRMENKLQKRIADNQNVGDWIGSAFYGAGTKLVANIANKVIGLNTLAMSGDKRALANYLDGKDESGNDLPWWQNPKYWNGVDQFASLDPNYISKVINDYGGLSKYTLQTAPGEERTFSVAVNEALKMAGYLASDAIVAGGLGKVASALAKGVGGASTIVDKAIAKSSPFAIGALNATGISEAYGIGTYDQTLQEANQRIDARIAEDSEKHISSKIGKDSGLVFNNGVLEGTSEESKVTASMINNYVKARTAEILRNNPGVNPDRIDREALYEEGLNQYSEILRQQYMNEHSEEYDSYRQLAKDAAATAYLTDFLLEEARMSAANVTYRKFLLGDAQRKALMNNYENLRTVERGKDLAVRSAAGASANYSKWQPLIRNIWGGTRDNYLDDVTVAFSKGLAISQFNDAMDSEVSPEQYYATVSGLSRFLSSFSDGVKAAHESMTDPRSLFDGFVGGLGSAITIAPRLGRILKGDAGNAYDQMDIARQAFENRDQTTGIIDIEGYKNSEQFQKDVEAGKIRRRSTAEILNDYIFNPLLQDYSDASQRLRDYQYIVDTANKTINEYRESGKLDEIIRFASAFNGATAAEEGRSLADAKDKKAKEAFAIVRQLQDWTQNDPVFSQSSYLQQVQQQLEDFSQGKIDNETIAQFLNRPENKSVKEDSNAENIAKERIQSNAKQLLKMQQDYTEAMNNIKSSRQYQVIANTVGAESVANQLAFYKAMYENRVTRLSEMEKEISGSTAPSEISSHIALYGSEEGRQRYEDYQNELIAAQEKNIQKIQSQLESFKKAKVDSEQKRIAVKSKEMELAEARRRLRDSKAELNNIRRAKGLDYSTVLTKSEILSLNPVERARMLESRLDIQKDESPAQYSEAQRQVIDEVVRELNLKDPTLLEQVMDSRTLYERNQDLAKANEIMQNDMRAASEYYTWARGQRIFGAVKVLDRRIRDYNDSILDSIDDADTDRLIAQAKKFSSDLLNDYIKRHPEREALLSPIAKLADLKEDVHNAIHTLFEGNDEKIKNYAQRIDNLYDSSVITNADQALSAFEDLVDGSEGEVSEDFNNILEKLKDYNWLRNATKLEERKARKEEEAKLDEEKRKKEDGSSYGWEGYKVGDTVYHTTKRTNYTGYVVSFDPITNAMHVRWGENKTTEAITDKSKVTKDPAVRNSSQETADKGSDTYMPSESSLEEGTGRTLFSSPKSLDSEGSVVTPSPEQEGKAAEAASDVQVIAPTLEEPIEVANKLAPLEGVFIGNALYEYDASLLKNSEKGQRIAQRNEAKGSLKAFYEWEDATNTNVQAIIDDELTSILDENPNIEVRFMMKKSEPSDKMGDVVLQVVEFTPQVEKHHIKDSDGKYLNGGVFTSGGKRWLVIGTFGYNPSMSEMKTAWMNTINTIKSEGRSFFNANTAESYYVSPNFSTKVDSESRYAGWIVDAFNTQEAGTVRTLKSLMSDKRTNPHGINYDNAVFGIMRTKDKFFVINKNNIAEGKQVFPPRDVERNLGLVFIMVPSSNGNYLPVALEPVVLKDINPDSTLATFINRNIDKLTSPELRDREEGLVGLSQYLVFSKGGDEIRVKGDIVTVVRNGIEKAFNVNDPTFGVSLRNEITEISSFRINISPKVLQDSTLLEIYDEAGALTTTSAKLGTVNAGYNVLAMDSTGKPIEKASSQNNETQVSVSSPKATVSYLGEEFTITDNNQVFDLNGQNVPDNLAIQVRLANFINTQNLQPEHVSEKGNAQYYRVKTNTSRDIVAIQFEDGRVAILSGKELGTYNSRLARKRADEAAREAIRNAQPLPDQAGEGRTLGFSRSDVASSTESSLEGIQTQQQPAQQESEQKETKKVKQPEAKKKIDNGIISKPVTNSENQAKTYNFGTELRNATSRTHVETINFLTRKGVYNENMSLNAIKSELKKLNISFDTVTNEDSFIEMLNNCK